MKRGFAATIVLAAALLMGCGSGDGGEGDGATGASGGGSENFVRPAA